MKPVKDEILKDSVIKDLQEARAQIRKGKYISTEKLKQKLDI
jgi:hypothetical protein